MLTQFKKSWLIVSLTILLLVFLIAFGFLLVTDKNFRDLKSGLAVIFASIIILTIWIIHHKTSFSWGDELQKTIQLEIFSYTYIAFQAFLCLFILMEITYRFKMEPMEVLVTTLLGISTIQLVVSFFVKRKYK